MSIPLINIDKLYGWQLSSLHPETPRPNLESMLMSEIGRIEEQRGKALALISLGYTQREAAKSIGISRGRVRKLLGSGVR